MPEASSVLYEVRGHKCFITLNRPRVMNALSSETRDELGRAVQRFTRDDDLFVGIIAGAGGQAFSAGADLKEMSDQHTIDRRFRVPGAYPDVPRPGSMPGHDDVVGCPKPLIAAVDGYCLAAGFELALWCDIRVATAASTFGLPEARRGLLSGPALIRLSRMIPLGEALRMHLTGVALDAPRAFQIGLIQGVLADRAQLDAEVERITDEIVSCSPLALQYIKRVVLNGREMTEAQQWNFAEMYHAMMNNSEDAAEGLRAFVEKRDPVWRPHD